MKLTHRWNPIIGYLFFLFVSACGREPLDQWHGFIQPPTEDSTNPERDCLAQEFCMKEGFIFDKRLVGLWQQPGWLYTYTMNALKDGTASHHVVLPTGEVLLDIDTVQSTNIDVSPHRVTGKIIAVRKSAIPDKEPVSVGDDFHCLYEFSQSPKTKKEKLKMLCSLDGTIPESLENDSTKILEKQGQDNGKKS